MKNTALLCLLVFMAQACTFSDMQVEKPNVLFIVIDDLNACLKGMNGETYVETPNINSLAARGVLFTNAHCAAPACNPSRTSVITGVAPSKSGLYKNWQDWRRNPMLKDWETLPHHFKNNGYETLGCGKIYHAASLTPQGFSGLLDPRPWDDYYPSKNRQLAPEVTPDHFPVNGNPKFYGGHFDWAALDISPDEMGDAKVVDWAAGQLSKKHDKPLFLAVGLYRPHIPWWTPKQYFDMHPIEKEQLPEVPANDMDDVPQAGIDMTKHTWHKWMVENNKWKEAVQAYNASVSFADDMVGRLLKALNDGPLAKNTVIILWSDHGYHLGQKQHWEKFSLWEQTTRVPLIIAAPGKFKVGEKCKQAVSLLDIYPTLNELCGLTAKNGLSGRSLVPLLKNPEKETGRAVLITQGFNNHAVRSKDWRYIRYADGSEELYDQVNDPKNFTNLAGDKRFESIKMELAKHLPKVNTTINPKENYNQKIKKKNMNQKH